jgi:PAS domain S-box-containing protein
MNLLYVTGNLSHADYLEHELGKIAPHIHLDVSPGNQDVLGRLSAPGRYDAVLVDSAISGADSQDLIARIRQKNLPVAIIAMAGPSDEDPPLKLLDAGADDYLIKKPNFVKSLSSLLQRVLDRRIGVEPDTQSLEVLHTGDLQRARRFFSNPDQLKLHPLVLDSDGNCVIPAGVPGKTPIDAVVLDESVHGAKIMRALKEILAAAPEVPVFLLLAPGQESLANLGLKLGARDYILKSGEYFHHIASSIENSVMRRNFAREKASTHAAESRLRLIIETIPACVARFSPHGTFQAINWTGLAMLGASRLDQLIGKNFPSLVGPENEERLKDFISRVSSGESLSIQFNWDGLDNVPRQLEMHAVPLGRELESRRAVLAVLHPVSSKSEIPPPAESEILERLQTEGESLRRQLETSQDEWKQEKEKLSEELSVAKGNLLETEQRFAQVALERDAGQARLEALLAGEKSEARLLEPTAPQEGFPAPEPEKDGEVQAAWETKCHALEERLLEAENPARQNMSIQSALEVREREIVQLHDEFVREKTLAAELQEQHTTLCEEFEHERLRWQAIQAESETKLAEADRQRKLFEETQAQLEAKVVELTSLLSQSESSGQQRIAGLEEELGAISRRVQESENQEASSEVRLKNTEARYAELEAQFTVARNEWEGVCRALQERRQAAEGEARRLEACVAELHEQIRLKWEPACRDLEQRCSEAECRYREASAGIEPIGDNLKKTESALAALDSEYRDARSQWDQTVKKWAAERGSLKDQIGELKNRLVEMESQHQIERDAWESARQSEKKFVSSREREELENRRSAVTAALRAIEARCAELAEQYRSELDRWDKDRTELETRREESDRMRAALEQSVRSLEQRLAETHEKELAEKSNSERAMREMQQQCEREKTEFDQSRIAMKQALTALETRCAELEEQCRIARADGEEKRNDLERLQTEIAARKETLEKALENLEIYQQELAEKQQSARESSEKLLRELEQQRAARISLQDALRISEARRAEILERQAADRSALEAAREEMERQTSTRLKLEEQLRNIELRLTQLAEEHRVERAELETMRQEIQSQRATRLALEEALHASETRTPGEQPTELAPAAIQALNELMARISDCLELLSRSLPPEDLCRMRGMRLLELGADAGKLALRLLALRSSPDPRIS